MQDELICELARGQGGSNKSNLLDRNTSDGIDEMICDASRHALS